MPGLSPHSGFKKEEAPVQNHSCRCQLRACGSGQLCEKVLRYHWTSPLPVHRWRIEATVRGTRARCDSARGGRQSVGRRASRHKYLQRVNELVKTASWADKASGARPRDASDCANFNEQVNTASWAGKASGARSRDASDRANFNEQIKKVSWLDKASGARPRDACD